MAFDRLCEFLEAETSFDRLEARGTVRIALKKAADAMSAQFSALGEDGWRLAKADAGFWCFSRVRAAQ